MTWPKYFPEQCPPQGSIEAIGEIVRLVSSNRPTKDDFISHWHLYPARRKEFKEKGLACKACGISVFKSIENAENLKKRLPCFRNKNVAIANLDSPVGKIMNTPTNNDKEHHTWWIPKKINDPSIYFKVVA